MSCDELWATCGKPLQTQLWQPERCHPKFHITGKAVLTYRLTHMHTHMNTAVSVTLFIHDKHDIWGACQRRYWPEETFHRHLTNSIHLQLSAMPLATLQKSLPPPTHTLSLGAVKYYSHFVNAELCIDTVGTDFWKNLLLKEGILLKKYSYCGPWQAM